jgi:predicted AAA+ superfamily ATPase
VTAGQPRAVLESYVHLYVRQEIQAEAGLVRAAKRQLGPLAVEEKGALFEGLVLHVLRAHGQERELFDDLFYWASGQTAQVEVDFLWPFERFAAAVASGRLWP